jgi:hypothetical protein
MALRPDGRLSPLLFVCGGIAKAASQSAFDHADLRLRCNETASSKAAA